MQAPEKLAAPRRMFDHEPETWQQLQELVAQLFRECGAEAEVGRTVEGVRGKKEIDVYVDDNYITPRSIYLCECKFWRDQVSQDVVHSFRTVVQDIGASRGFIISKAGFQAGCWEAAKNSNVELLTFEELQEQFFERWLEAYCETFVPFSDPLFPYWNPAGGRAPRRPWGESEKQRHRNIVEAFLPLLVIDITRRRLPTMPLPMTFPGLNQSSDIEGERQITTYREFFDFLNSAKREALYHFQALYGEVDGD
ncbi:MAG: restriction endonuclease [Gammaproteobacteria bacterium]|nr:restriction endonuclease [Gammaproteobacteria bacterium]